MAAPSRFAFNLTTSGTTRMAYLLRRLLGKTPVNFAQETVQASPLIPRKTGWGGVPVTHGAEPRCTQTRGSGESGSQHPALAGWYSLQASGRNILPRWSPMLPESTIFASTVNGTAITLARHAVTVNARRSSRSRGRLVGCCSIPSLAFFRQPLEVGFTSR